MWELLITVILLSPDGRASVFHRPPIAQVSREACDDSARSAEAARRDDLRVVATCVRAR